MRPGLGFGRPSPGLGILALSEVNLNERYENMKMNLIMNRPWLAGAALLMLVNTASYGADYPTTLLAEGPLAYWRFSETATSPALPEVVNLGSAGAAANGFLVLDATAGNQGRLGNAIMFVNAANDVGYCGSRLDIPYNPALNPAPPFSIEFWAKPNKLGGDASGSAPMCSMNPSWYGGGNRSGWLFYLNNVGRWQFRLGATSGYAGVCTATSGAAAVGIWQHIVATYDGETARLYANGVEIGTVAAPVAGWTPNNQAPLRIGGTTLHGSLGDGPAPSASGSCGNRGYDGLIDEVAIYPTVLDPETIAAHYSTASSNPVGYADLVLAKNPVGYWNLDESAVAEPDPAGYPVAVNAGSIGAEANVTVPWGALAAQPGPSFGGLGQNNSAVFMDSVRGRLMVGDAAALHISGRITLMAWIKPTVRDFFRNIIAQGWDSSYSETFLRISRGEGSGGYGDGFYYEAGVTDSDGAFYSYNVARAPIPDSDIGSWVFLVGTYDGTSWNLYRNGELVASTETTIGAKNVGTPWTIGGRAGPPSPTGTLNEAGWEADGLFFGGWMDEPAIFNKALSADKIRELYVAAQVAPNITKPPVAPSGIVYSGSSVTFTASAEGGPPLSYSWTLDGAPTGVTAPEYTASNLPAGKHVIAFVVTNPYGTITSPVEVDVVSAPPIITRQPSSATWYAGRPFTFSVAAGGSQPLTYQWKLNGNPIPGATSSTYTDTASAASGGSYTVVVSNSAGQTESDAGSLTVIPITGAYVSAVIADSPLGYWRLGESSGTVAYDYQGGNNGTYYSATLGQPGYSGADTDTAAQFAGVNSRVGDIDGTKINFTGFVSFTLEAWVNGAANQPDQSTIMVKGIGADGTTATEQFAIDVSGGKYRFFVRRDANTIYDTLASVGPNGAWQHVVGVYNETERTMTLYVDGEVQDAGETSPVGLNTTTTPFTIGSKRLGNDPSYNGTFSGLIDEVAVYDHALTAEQVQAHYGAAFGPNVAPQIRTQPQNATNYVTLPASFGVSAFGSVPLSYQWKRNGQDIPGANSYRYALDAVTSADAGDYTVTVSNGAGSVTSDPAKLVVLPAPSADVSVPDLVVHLPFNGSLNDTTGRGNNGTGYRITGGQTNTAAPAYTTGKLGQAVSYATDAGTFDSPLSPPTTSFVSLGVKPDLQFGAETSFTVAFWVRLPLNYIGGDLPFFSTAVGSTFSTGIVLAPSYGSGATASNTGDTEGCWAFSLYDADSNGVGVYGEQLTGTGQINDGEWNHLIYVFDRVNGATVYRNGRIVNGERQSGTSIIDAGDIDTGDPAVIGQDPTGSYPESGSADIDDFGVWRRALTPLEAASIYMAGMNGKSFVYVPPAQAPTMSVGKDGTNWKITYTGTLQSSATASGGYTDVSGASSPFTVPTTTGTQQFYRARN